MIKVFCDRCNRQIYDGLYNIKIYGESVIGGQTVETATNNLNENLFNEKHYCKKCVEDFREFLKHSNKGD